MKPLAIALAFVAALGLSGCGDTRTIRYEGPQVTRIVVMKSQRKMMLLHGATPLATYDIGLGFRPEGDKLREGDGKTPTGRYYIDRRNRDSKFHLSIGISYPNAEDVAEARAAGVKPGGDIFIHGWSRKVAARRGRDWTWGCIAVANEDIEQIYAMVGTGTPIDIYE